MRDHRTVVERFHETSLHSFSPDVYGRVRHKVVNHGALRILSLRTLQYLIFS